MNFKLASVIAFVICQVYPIWAQQQGTNPALVPGGWVRPLYAAAAEAWREYFIRAQQATNQLYQQWANMSGNPLSNAMGGLGGLYGIGNIGQPGSGNQPPRPLQGIFNPGASIQSGLQLSELLPVNERPGKQDAKVQAPLQDQVQETRPQVEVQQQAAPIKPQTQAQAQSQPRPSQVVQPPVQPPVQQVPPVQPQTAQAQAQSQPRPSQVVQPPVQPPVQQVPPVQPQTAQAPQPHVQQQNSVPSQIAGVPLQTVGQAANPVGLFGSSNPLGWMG